MPLRVKNGKWEYRFVLNGERVTQLTDLAATEQNAIKAAKIERNRRDAILRGEEESRKPRSVLFIPALPDFFGYCDVEHKDHPNTTKRVRTSMASLQEFFKRFKVAAIQSHDVNRYKIWRLNQHKIKPVTLRHDLDTLSKFFNWAIQQKMCSKNPVREVTKPSLDDAIRMHIFTDAEEFLYFAEAFERSIDLHDVATIEVNQGMRPEEIIEIEIENVDLTSRTLRITKGKTKAARRIIRLTSESVQILKRRIQHSQTNIVDFDRLCQRLGKKLKLDPEVIARRERLKNRFAFPARRVGKQGKGHISLSGLENAHNDVLVACERKGQPISAVLYDFRHTFATRAAQDGMPLPTLAKALGHSSLRQVLKYVHPTQDHLQMETDRLDSIRQTRKRAYKDSVSQAQSRPTTTGELEDFKRLDGTEREILQ